MSATPDRLAALEADIAQLRLDQRLLRAEMEARQRVLIAAQLGQVRKWLIDIHCASEN